MTVKELKEALSLYADDIEVVVSDTNTEDQMSVENVNLLDDVVAILF